MDASENPEKAKPSLEPTARDQASESVAHSAGQAGEIAANSNIPTVDSPSVVPEQGEHIDAPAAAAPVTALVISQPRFDGADHGAGFGASARDKARATYAAFTSSLGNLHLPKVSQLAATIMLAAGIGAIAGSLSTFAVSTAMAPPPPPSPVPLIAETRALKDTVMRLTADLAGVKASADASIKAATAQITRMTERLERTEKQRFAAAVPAPVPPATISAVPSPVAANSNGAQTETTASINRQAAPLGFSKDASRLPVISGWVLQNVYDGTAYIQSPEGRMEVVVGDRLPDGGQVQEIRRHNGRWIVVTTRGLVMMR